MQAVTGITLEKIIQDPQASGNGGDNSNITMGTAGVL